MSPRKPASDAQDAARVAKPSKASALSKTSAPSKTAVPTKTSAPSKTKAPSTSKPFPRREDTPQLPDPARAAALLKERKAAYAVAAAAAAELHPQRDLLARGFTLASLNCCGIRSAERRGLPAWLQRTRPDVVCLQEVRAWPDQVEPELRCPNGYNSRWLPAGRKGYSGVATYSRASADRYAEGSGLWWGDEEARVLRADFGELSVVNLYSPSGSSSADRQILKFSYLEHLAEFAAGLLAEGRPVALCGDFNIAHTALDIRNATSNAKNSGFLVAERAWFSALLELGWVDVLRTLHPGEPNLYSWWSNRGQARANDVGWRIDYVLASPSLARLARDAWIEKDAELSDHAPVWVRFAPRAASA